MKVNCILALISFSQAISIRDNVEHKLADENHLDEMCELDVYACALKVKHQKIEVNQKEEDDKLKASILYSANDTDEAPDLTKYYAKK